MVPGRSGKQLRLKLKLLRDRIRVWNKDSFGAIKAKKNSLLEEIQYWDSIDDQRGLSDPQKQLRDLAKQKYEKVTCLEEIKWKQRAKVKWLKEGDNNTRFFHRIASYRRNINYIMSLLDDDGREVEREHLNGHIVSYFMKLFKESGI